MCHVPHHLPKQLRGCGRRGGPFPKRRSQLRFPSTRQVSSPRARKLARTPCPRPFRPIHSPSRLHTGPCFCALSAAARDRSESGREATVFSSALSPRGSASFRTASIESSVLLAPRARRPLRAWPAVDGGGCKEANRASATHRHHEKQEERVKFPAQGLMGQEAGSLPKLTREMRKRKRGASAAA